MAKIVTKQYINNLFDEDGNVKDNLYFPSSSNLTQTISEAEAGRHIRIIREDPSERITAALSKTRQIEENQISDGNFINFSALSHLTLSGMTPPSYNYDYCLLSSIGTTINRVTDANFYLLDTYSTSTGLGTSTYNEYQVNATSGTHGYIQRLRTNAMATSMSDRNPQFQRSGQFSLLVATADRSNYYCYNLGQLSFTNIDFMINVTVNRSNTVNYDLYITTLTPVSPITIPTSYIMRISASELTTSSKTFSFNYCESDYDDSDLMGKSLNFIKVNRNTMTATLAHTRITLPDIPFNDMNITVSL